MRGLYIHIPFCKHICNYCDFPKRIAMNNSQIDEYVNYVIKDFDNYQKYYSSVESIYIGGGTPNMLSDDNLEKLLNTIKSLNISPKEFTIECNPELITKSQIILFKKYGINRVSLGVESFIDSDLKLLNRHHTKNDVEEKINWLRDAGINNINVDLIFAHPYDSLEKVKYCLEEFFKLRIPHLSYYSMILEDKTVFSHLLSRGEINLIDNDTEASMYEYIIKELKSHGYHHYETSNFALPGYESIHNQIYWDSKEYIGIGAGASGYLSNVRYTNSSKLKDYYENIKETEKIDLLGRKKEFFLLGFRKIDGVSIKEYQKRFNSDPLFDFNFKKLLDEGLVEINMDIIKLTSRGIMMANEVFMEFI